MFSIGEAEQSKREIFRKTFLVISTFLVSCFIGIAIFSFLPLFKDNSLDEYQNGYHAGFNTARKLAEESTVGNFFKTPEDVRNLAGVVTAINGDKIVLKIQRENPFDMETPRERTVIVDASTIITMIVVKEQNVFQSEMSAYMQSNAQNTLTTCEVGSTVVPPVPFTIIDAGLMDIKTGDLMKITTIENVKTMKEFTAKEIQVQPPVSTSEGLESRIIDKK